MGFPFSCESHPDIRPFFSGHTREGAERYICLLCSKVIDVGTGTVKTMDEEWGNREIVPHDANEDGLLWLIEGRDDGRA